MPGVAPQAGGLWPSHLPGTGCSAAWMERHDVGTQFGGSHSKALSLDIYPFTHGASRSTALCQGACWLIRAKCPKCKSWEGVTVSAGAHWLQLPEPLLLGARGHRQHPRGTPQVIKQACLIHSHAGAVCTGQCSRCAEPKDSRLGQGLQGLGKSSVEAARPVETSLLH